MSISCVSLLLFNSILSNGLYPLRPLDTNHRKRRDWNEITMRNLFSSLLSHVHFFEITSRLQLRMSLSPFLPINTIDDLRYANHHVNLSEYVPISYQSSQINFTGKSVLQLLTQMHLYTLEVLNSHRDLLSPSLSLSFVLTFLLSLLSISLPSDFPVRFKTTHFLFSLSFYFGIVVLSIS